MILERFIICLLFPWTSLQVWLLGLIILMWLIPSSNKKGTDDLYFQQRWMWSLKSSRNSKWIFALLNFISRERGSRSESEFYCELFQSIKNGQREAFKLWKLLLIQKASVFAVVFNALLSFFHIHSFISSSSPFHSLAHMRWPPLNHADPLFGTLQIIRLLKFPFSSGSSGPALHPLPE